MPNKNPTSGSLFMVVGASRSRKSTPVHTPPQQEPKSHTSPFAGKSTRVNALLKQEPEIKLSISYTTRPPRPGEEHGREYYFTTADDFLKRQADGEFLEWAEVHGNYYGTSRLMIADQISNGTDVLLEIDWQGAQQVKKQFSNAIGIFILPPSIAALEERLKNMAKGFDDLDAPIMRLSISAFLTTVRAPGKVFTLASRLLLPSQSPLT